MKNIGTVCIIDDDDIYQFTASREISFTNLVDKIITFSNGEKAIMYLKNVMNDKDQLPDMVFLDLNMPVMDGWQFLEEYIELKYELKKEIIIYVVSSSIDERDQKRAKNINEVADYILKPISKAKFVELFSGNSPLV